MTKNKIFLHVNFHQRKKTTMSLSKNISFKRQKIDINGRSIKMVAGHVKTNQNVWKRHFSHLLWRAPLKIKRDARSVSGTNGIFALCTEVVPDSWQLQTHFYFHHFSFAGIRIVCPPFTLQCSRSLRHCSLVVSKDVFCVKSPESFEIGQCLVYFV